jgi:general secretion pathway protein D
MIEVTQKTFDELGADVALGQGNVPGAARIFGSGAGEPSVDTATRSMTDGLRGSGPVIGKASIDQLLSLSKGQDVPSATSSSPSAFKLLGVLTDPQLEATLYALAQKKGRDVLASPTILAKSGQKSNVHVVREFPYPTEFDPPEIPQNVGNLAQGGNQATYGISVVPIIPTTPTTFEVKEIGTVLEVEPVISDDGRTVELSIAPSHTEFDGFVDYGSDIRNQYVSQSPSVLIPNVAIPFIVDNPIVQPVFKKSALSTSVIIWDGSTVALGAVMTQEVTDQEDKVPMIGDIPLVGRAFQNKISQVITKHLIFFVTVDVIDPAGRKVNAAAEGATAQN